MEESVNEPQVGQGAELLDLDSLPPGSWPKLRVVLACIYDPDTEEVLLGYRPKGKSVIQGLFGWETPGGKVEEGESPDDAVLRECYEEIHPDWSQLLDVELRPASDSSTPFMATQFAMRMPLVEGGDLEVLFMVYMFRAYNLSEEVLSTLRTQEHSAWRVATMQQMRRSSERGEQVMSMDYLRNRHVWETIKGLHALSYADTAHVIVEAPLGFQQGATVVAERCYAPGDELPVPRGGYCMYKAERFSCQYIGLDGGWHVRVWCIEPNCNEKTARTRLVRTIGTYPLECKVPVKRAHSTPCACGSLMEPMAEYRLLEPLE